MKILHIINSLATGGAEKLVTDIVPLIQKQKVNVDVLVLKDEETPFYRILESNTIDKIFDLTAGSVYNPMLVFKIIPYLNKYDIVHIHLFPALYWTVIAKWFSFSKTKLIYTEHSTDNRRRHNPILRLIDKLIYKSIDQIITIAKEVDSKLKEYLNDNNTSKFRLISNGVDINKLLNTTSYSKSEFFSEKDFILIQVSSFRYPKDQDTLIKSLSLLPRNIKLLLVGDGPLKYESEYLVKKLNLQNRVRFLGNRSDVSELLQMVDVAVLSSHYEGLSLSSIEGMATNPFIASNVQGLREIVKGHGLLFPQGDDKELARLILKLYEDREFYTNVKIKCLSRAKGFDISKMVDGYVELYECVLKEN